MIRRNRWHGGLFALALTFSVACGEPAGSARPTLDEVLALGRARDYFALRDRLDRVGDDTPAVRYGRSLVRHAFNDLTGSNVAIAAARRGGGLPDTLLFRLAALEVTNDLRLFQYPAGLARADTALAAPPAGIAAASIDDLRNLRRILAALATTPPQQVVRRDATTFRLEQGRAPVTVGDSARRYILDTGANLSVLTRSEARALGLRILEADVDVGSSTDVRNSADLAVADRVTIGRVALEHVVFLVFDDAALTFPGVIIQGIIGFPVIEALGEVRISEEGVVTVPAEPPHRPVANLALDGHTPLTTVRWEGQTLLCRLDTGANTTDVYEPFYRRFRAGVDSLGRLDTLETGGVGGIRSLPIRVLRDFRIEVGDTTFRYDSLPVITRSITPTEADNYLFCNLGHDLLDRFSEMVLNFRDMSFLLR